MAPLTAPAYPPCFPGIAAVKACRSALSPLEENQPSSQTDLTATGDPTGATHHSGTGGRGVNEIAWNNPRRYSGNITVHLGALIQRAERHRTFADYIKM